MPYAVTHFLIPVIIASLIRDHIYKKTSHKFSLHYVLIAGLAGVAPDLDIAAFWVLRFFGFTLEQLHRTGAHSLLIPLVCVLLFFALHNVKVKGLGRHRLHIAKIFLVVSFGVLTHILLDGIFAGHITPFYPFSTIEVGLNLLGYLPNDLEILAPASLDAALLIIYVLYLELKHKISDFI